MEIIPLLFDFDLVYTVSSSVAFLFELIRTKYKEKANSSSWMADNT